MAAPPSGGPSTVELQVVDSIRALAVSRSPGATTDLRQAPLAALNVMSAAPETTDTASSWPKLSTPKA